MKIHLISCLLFLAAPLFLSAQENPALLKNRLNQLEAKRVASLKAMAEKRKELIQKDPTLRKIHDKIIQEHRKLALILDSKKEIHAMNDALIKLDREIQDTMDKIEKAEKEQAEKMKAASPAAAAPVKPNQPLPGKGK